MQIKLKEIVSFAKGKQIDTKNLPDDGQYVYLNGGILPSGRWFNCNVPGDTITISEGGNSCGFVNYIKEPFWCGGHCYYLFDVKGNKKYLYYALKSKQDKIMALRSGACMPNIRKNDLAEFMLFYEKDMAFQAKIVDKLDKLEELISAANLQLAKLDEFVKSKFVEMFGDPEINDRNLPCKKMSDLCNIIDGDRGKNYPSQDDFCDKGYCLFLNAKNVTSQGFDFSHCMFISEERDNLLRKGKLLLGDVVLTTRGTIGNLANYTEDVPFENIRINSGMVILRFSHNVNKVFFITQFRMLLKQIKNSIVSGTAQPQLPISTMNKIKLIVPAIAKQNQFADYVCKVDGIKNNVRKSLNNLETLKKSLMQEYFG